ncbi:MAG: glycosyltransferase [Bacteroides sp.]|nr:glycosyltransferase [Bacteroides sp.]
MPNPKISVVTVCYNAADTIEETMLSVLNQTYDNVEYIIIDGGSTDGTVEIIKKYADRLDYWVSEPDKGIYDAMNKGIDAATGEYINFMNAGDKFYSDNTIEKILFNGDIIYGNAVFKYKNFTLLYKPRPLSSFENCFPIYHQATFVKTKILRLNPFSLKYKSSSDYDLLYRLYKNKHNFNYIDEIICLFDAENGISSTNIRLQLKESGEINGKISTMSYQVTIRLILLKLAIQKILNRVSPQIYSKLRKRSLLRNSYITQI